MTDSWKYTNDDSTPGVYIPGNRDAWAEVVFNINKTDTPFYQRIPKKTTKSTKWTWMTEELNDPSAKSSDAQAQGATTSASETPRAECFNYTQIFSRRADVSGSAQEQMHIGVPDEMNRQMLNHAKVMKKSIQLRALAGVGYRVPTAGSAAGVAFGFPGLAGFFGDITLHMDGSTRKYGVDNTTNVDIQEEDFEEDGTTYHGFTKFKAVQQKIWKLGSMASECYCGIIDKAYVSLWDTSGVTRYTTKIDEVKELVDVIITDCGTVKFIPIRELNKYDDVTASTFDGTAGLMIKDFALLVDPAYCATRMFRDFRRYDLAKVGDLISEEMVTEFTFELSAPYGMVVFNFTGASAHGTTHKLWDTAASYVLA